MRKEDEEIEAKCPLSGISCENCKWRIEYKKYPPYGERNYREDCFLFELTSVIECLMGAVDDLKKTLVESIKLKETSTEIDNNY
jgi:hypothetical protein